MAYDPHKDKMIELWKCQETGLMVSINRYGDGEPKVQIGPRILAKKDGTERAPAKAGRLSIEDVLWLYEIIDDPNSEKLYLVMPVADYGESIEWDPSYTPPSFAALGASGSFNAGR